MKGKRLIGRISYWEQDRGFGFAEDDAGETFFCLLKEQVHPRFRGDVIIYSSDDRVKTAPEMGEYVSFEPIDNDQARRKASNWTLVRWENYAQAEQAKELLRLKNLELARQAELDRQSRDREILRFRREKRIMRNRQAAAATLQFARELLQ